MPQNGSIEKRRGTAGFFRGVTEGEWGIVKCREIAGVRGAGE